jgi:hypothetical protein
MYIPVSKCKKKIKEKEKSKKSCPLYLGCILDSSDYNSVNVSNTSPFDWLLLFFYQSRDSSGPT